MNRLRRGLVTGVVPAVVALLVSLIVLAIVLAVLGVDPVKSLKALFDFGPTPRAESNQIRTWINRSVPLFLSGLAVSVGFRMNLFNIGVEGQYSVAAVVAAAPGAVVHHPPAQHIAVIFLVGNLAAGSALILGLRALTGHFISIYWLNDISLLVLSVIQAIAFHCWRRHAK